MESIPAGGLTTEPCEKEDGLLGGQGEFQGD